MLRSAKATLGYRLIATDGEFGKIHDMSFDDLTWTIRYIVAETGSWLFGRLVLLSPAFFGSADWLRGEVPVSLTKLQIEQSPSIDTKQTVSRQRETELQQYYGWPAYWIAVPADLGLGFPANTPARLGTNPPKCGGDPHLRSIREVTGYHIQAKDGDIGHVDDFVFQDDAWIIRYLVVDTRDWLHGRRVLIPPGWTTVIHWSKREVCVENSREAIQNAPEYDSFDPVNRVYEERLYDYYGRPKYW